MKLDLSNPAWWHNCAAPEPRDGLPGFALPRYPAAVRAALNPMARWWALDSCGVELRFVTDAPSVRVTLGASAEGSEVIVWRGDFYVTRQRLESEIPVTIQLEPPPRMQGLAEDAPLRRRFSPVVWRVEFSRGQGVIYSVDAADYPIRPVTPDEVPSRRWLAYGSSITHADTRGYVQHAARLLGVDVLNKGLAGSCHAERETAEFFHAGERWDFITAELGVNMRGEFNPEAFAERATSWLNLIHQTRPEAPLGVITHFLNAQHVPKDAETETARRQRAFDRTLREWVYGQDKVHIRLFEGTEILDDFTLLTGDLLHPAEPGHIRMGENLATMLREARFHQ